MKTNLLKTIAIVIFSGCFSFNTHAQNTNGKIWVRIENEKVLPTQNPVTGNLESSDLEFNSLIQNFNVISVEKALPSSRKASLLIFMKLLQILILLICMQQQLIL